MYQAQEVAAVVAETRYQAADAITAVYVDYEPLPVLLDPFKAMQPDAPVLRPDRGPDKQNNHIWHWESGDRAATDAALAASDKVVPIDVYIPRIHVASIETCGCIADFDPVQGHLDFHVTSQAPHVYRTVISLVSGIPESNIRVKTHDIGGGFGGKVPVYPGYVCAIVASLTLGRPVKWIEDRSENLQADSFARDYHVHAELGLTNDGTITASASRRSPTTATATRRPIRRPSRPASSTSSPARTRCPRPSSRSTGHTRTSLRAVSPTAARSG
jgi:carbon-monoxide dehydrogenase large subunit